MELQRLFLRLFKHGMKKMNEEEKEYDVVVDVLTKHRDKLWEMTRRNMQSEFIGMNIMDDIRLAQIEQIDEAIKLWNNRNVT
jgi:hypothetical protein